MKPTQLRQRMQELRANQRAKDAGRNLFGNIPTDELAAIKKLAHETFGERATLFATKEERGIVQVGFVDAVNNSVPPWQRRETIVAKGRTHAEILAQLKLWKGFV